MCEYVACAVRRCADESRPGVASLLPPSPPPSYLSSGKANPWKLPRQNADTQTHTRVMNPRQMPAHPPPPRTRQPVSANQLNRLRPESNPVTDSPSGLPSSTQPAWKADSRGTGRTGYRGQESAPGLQRTGLWGKESTGNGDFYRGVEWDLARDVDEGLYKYKGKNRIENRLNLKLWIGAVFGIGTGSGLG